MKLLLYPLFSLLFCSYSSQATIFYTTSGTATLEDISTPSQNWTINPDGVTGLYNPIITENDELILLGGAYVAANSSIIISKLTINGSATMVGPAEIIIRFTTTLNNGILVLDDIDFVFGNGDNDANAGKILGSPNGISIGIDATIGSAYIIFKGGLFTTPSLANVIMIPNGTFLNNTISFLEINSFSILDPYQVELNTALTITHVLNLANGVLKTSTDVTKRLLIGLDASVSGQYINSSNYSYVSGTIYRYTNAANSHDFPIGGGLGKYRPVKITPTANTLTLYSVKYTDFELAENNILYNAPKCGGSNLISVEAGEQYDIQREGTGSNAAVELPYIRPPSNYWSGGVSPDNSHNIVIAHHNTTNTCWERVSGTTLNGAVADGIFISLTLSSFGSFTFGYGLASVLPLQNLKFTARSNGDLAILNWHTENEINTNRFEIEYSINGYYFKNAGLENAKNLGVNEYAFSHSIPAECGDVIYYRLKIIDNDGSFKYSNILKMMLLKTNELVVYPNPAVDHIILKNATGVLMIYNSVGVRMFSQKITTVNQRVNIAGLPRGFYVAKLVVGGEVRSVRFERM